MKLAIEQGDVDVAFRGFSAAEIAQLRTETAAGVQVLEGPGSEIHYLVFDVSKAPVNNARRAPGDRAGDRSRRAREHGLRRHGDAAVLADAGGALGAKPVFQTAYGAPNVANAQAILAAAGITTPVALDAWYTPTHYGPEEAAGLGEIRRQLEASGLFTVKLGAQEWDALQGGRLRTHKYPLYGLGWFADYLDGDNFLRRSCATGASCRTATRTPR